MKTTADTPDPRAEGVRSLRQYMPLPADDAEARIERRMLRRMDLTQQVRG